MRVVIKEWLKDKRASITLVIFCVASCAKIFVDARLIINIGITFANPDQWKYNLVILSALCLIRTSLGIIASVSNRWSRYKVFETMNNKFADKMLDSDYDLFTKFSVARITTISGFMSNVCQVGASVVEMIKNIVNITVTLVNMYVLAGNIIIPVIIIYAIGIVLMRILFKIYDKQAIEFEKSRKERNQELENIINGFQEVRSFNVIESKRNLIYSMNNKMSVLRINKLKTTMGITTMIELLDSVGIIIVTFYSINRVIGGEMSVSTAMSLVMFVIRIAAPLIQTLNFTDELASKLSLAKDYDELMKYKNIDHPEAIMTLNSFKDKISINDVKFAYSETSSVLNGLNMEIHKGEKIGICGESGNGKSTLLKLLNRFYIPNSGSISIDGVDINLTTLKSYRHMVGSVHQENIIFPGTIKQNILFAVPNATEYELIEACRKSEILDFVLSLPGKFDTIVGPRGLTLSGGQKQRIALARLFLQDPEIILLDEATSALDNETENLIQDAIKKLEGKTIITVAHRLSTIKDCDKIYVMKGGIVAECGTHEELMDAHGLYFSMNK